MRAIHRRSALLGLGAAVLTARAFADDDFEDVADDVTRAYARKMLYKIDKRRLYRLRDAVHADVPMTFAEAASAARRRLRSSTTSLSILA